MRFLVAIHHPDDYDPSVSEGEVMTRDIDLLNEEMEAAGVRVFAGGLHPARTAKSLRALLDGSVSIEDGPYLKTAEHVGGFWMLEVASLDEALEWGRKAVLACRAFARRKPVDRRTWRMRLGPSGVQAVCEHPDDRVGFDRRTFAADPRIAALPWDR